MMRSFYSEYCVFFSMIPLTAPFLSLDIRSLFFLRDSLFSRLCEHVARAYSVPTTKPSRGELLRGGWKGCRPDRPRTAGCEAGRGCLLVQGAGRRGGRADGRASWRVGVFSVVAASGGRFSQITVRSVVELTVDIFQLFYVSSMRALLSRWWSSCRRRVERS